MPGARSSGDPATKEAARQGSIRPLSAAPFACLHDRERQGFQRHPHRELLDRGGNEFVQFFYFPYSQADAQVLDGRPTQQWLICATGGVDAQNGSRTSVSGPVVAPTACAAAATAVTGEVTKMRDRTPTTPTRARDSLRTGELPSLGICSACCDQLRRCRTPGKSTERREMRVRQPRPRKRATHRRHGEVTDGDVGVGQENLNTVHRKIRTRRHGVSVGGQRYPLRPWSHWWGVPAHPTASTARAMASASSRVTEPTPGRMPAAVAQCTDSVGTP